MKILCGSEYESFYNYDAGREFSFYLNHTPISPKTFYGTIYFKKPVDLFFGNASIVVEDAGNGEMYFCYKYENERMNMTLNYITGELQVDTIRAIQPNQMKIKLDYFYEMEAHEESCFSYQPQRV